MNYTKSPFLFLLSFLFLVISQWSCNKSVVKTLTRRVDLKAVQYLKGASETDFTGLKDILGKNGSKLTNIILTHGVREKKSTHFESLMNDLASKAQYDVKYSQSLLVDTLQSGLGKNGEVHVYDFLNEKQDTLRFFHIFWSPVTAPIKDLVYQIDDNNYRTFFSDTTKKKFMVDVFGDIALYAGPYKRLMQAPVNLALNDIIRRDNSKEHPGKIVMISGSFGSKIVFDVLMSRIKVQPIMDNILQEMTNSIKNIAPNVDAKLAIKELIEKKRKSIQFGEEGIKYYKSGILPDYILWGLNGVAKRLEEHLAKSTSDAAAIQVCTSELNLCKAHFEKAKQSSFEIGSRLVKIYMISNQLPFTSLTELSTDTKANQADFINNIFQSLEIFLDQRPKEIKDTLEIISFHDPNDPFGFRIPQPSAKASRLIKVNNVELYNTIQWSLDPYLVKDFVHNFIGIKELPIDLNQFLRQDTFRQIFNFTLDEPSEQARNNQAIVNHVLDGSEPKIVASKLTLVDCNCKKDKVRKVSGNYNVEPITINTCKRVERTTKRKGKKKGYLIKEKKGLWYRLARLRFLLGLGVSGFAQQIKKMDARPAQLPRELPAQDIEFNQHKELDFEGIQAALRAHEVVNILTIHGMRSKKPDHFDSMVEGLLRQLNFNEHPVKDTTYFVYPDVANSVAGHTQIRSVAYKNVENKLLRFFIVYWSPLTYPAKNLLSDLEAPLNLKDKSSFIPLGVKNDLIIDGFGDVALTLREFTPALHKNLNLAFELMLEPYYKKDRPSVNLNGDYQDNVYFISGSLGSKLLFDYVTTCLDKDSINHVHPNYRKNIGKTEYDNAKTVIQKLRTYFMLTNQLSLISMKDMHPNLDEIADFHKHVFGNWDALKGGPLNIIAFNDPNDLLSFRLPEKLDDSNVKVKNVNLNLAGGVEVKVLHLYKLSKKLNKLVRKTSKINKNLKRELKAEEKWKDFKSDYRSYKKSDVALNIIISEYVLPLLDKEYPRQHFVFDIDKAHSGASKNAKIIEMIAKGPKDIARTRK